MSIFDRGGIEISNSNRFVIFIGFIRSASCSLCYVVKLKQTIDDYVFLENWSLNHYVIPLFILHNFPSSKSSLSETRVVTAGFLWLVLYGTLFSIHLLLTCLCLSNQSGFLINSVQFVLDFCSYFVSFSRCTWTIHVPCDYEDRWINSYHLSYYFLLYLFFIL